MEALPQEMLDAIGELYNIAGAMFGSLDVRWCVLVTPDGFAGPQITLRVTVGESPRARKYKLMITHRLVANERERLRDELAYRVRSLRDEIRRGEH